MPGAVGINLKTASSAEVFAGDHTGLFIRLYGWIVDDGEPQISTEPEEFLKAIDGASIVYGHNVFDSTLVPLAEHHGVDYWDLSWKTIDTLVGERTLNPPYPQLRPGTPVNHAALRGKGLTSTDLHISYKMESVAARYGVPGRTGDLRTLADRFGGFDAIPQSLPEYLDLLRGDLLTSRGIYREIGKRAKQEGLLDVVRREMHIAAIQNAMYLKGIAADEEEAHDQVEQAQEGLDRAYAFLNQTAGIPLPNSEFKWRERVDVKIPLTTRKGRKIRARYESLFQRPCPDMRAGYRWRSKRTGPSPLSTTEGRSAFEAALRAAGVRGDDIPFTPGGTLALSKHALGEDAWVRGKESVPGLIAKYADNPQVVSLCRAAIQVASNSSKAEEVLKAICPDGRVHPRIGDLQASGRWAHVDPHVSNFGKRGQSLRQRRMIRAKKGHVLVSIDLDQIDPRAIAGWSRDPEYRKLAQPGMDVHREIAFRVFGSRSDEAREAAKATTNAWNYGQGLEGAAATTGLPLSVVRQFDQGMKAAFPTLCSWRTRLRQYAARTGTVPSKWRRPLRVIPGMEYTQAPAQIGQSTTRDLLCDGLLRMPREVLEMLILVIHDEIVLEVPVERVEEITRRAMAALTTVFEGVPITCGASPASESWIGCYEKAA